jgi:hypothetical protein
MTSTRQSSHSAAPLSWSHASCNSLLRPGYSHKISSQSTSVCSKLNIFRQMPHGVAALGCRTIMEALGERRLCLCPNRLEELSASLKRCPDTKPEFFRSRFSQPQGKGGQALSGVGRGMQVGAHHAHFIVFFVEVVEKDVA